MRNVVPNRIVRASHAPRYRKSHSEDAALQVTENSEELFKQDGIDEWYGEQNLQPGSVTGGTIRADTITSENIRAGSITATEIAVGAFGLYNVLKNGDFEEGWSDSYITDSTLMYGWAIRGSTQAKRLLLSSNVKSGFGVLAFQSTTGSTANVGVQQTVPVVPGRTYRLSGWNWKGAAAGDPAWLRANSVAPDGSTVVSFNVINLATNATTAAIYDEGYYTVPSDNTVGYLRVDCISAGTPGGTEVFAFDDVLLELMPAAYKNTAATVTIDETGITILNGALTLQDEFGKTVMTASGFSGSWFDYVNLGLYNARFLDGTTGSLSMGRTSGLPYWTLSQLVGSPTATKMSTGGVEIGFAALNNSMSITSDAVPVHSDRYYGLSYTREVVRAAGSLDIVVKIQWFDSSGSSISTTTVFTQSLTANFGPSNIEPNSVLSPVNASTAKVIFEITETGTHSSSNKYRITAGTLRLAPHSLNTSMLMSLDSLAVVNLDVSLVTDSPIFQDGFESDGPMDWNSVISPTAISANTDDWNPTGLSTANFIRIGSDATPRNLTGIVAPSTDGRVIWLHNRNSSTTITLVHDATSTAANRFYCPGAANFSLTGKKSVMLIYSGTDSRWLVMG